MKVSELFAKAEMKPISRGKNLDLLGWVDGYLLVVFRGRPTRYIFGPNIPESEFHKILKNPFPDRLFTTNIKNKFQCHKVNRAV